MSDSLGDRLLMFDNSGTPSLELLRFRPELSDAPGFEAALREQVQRLAGFEHPAFASVRSVERLEPDDDLALVSNHTPGKRLSEILHRAKGPALAAALIKQLAPAIAQFQQQNPGVYRGLLSPDRIVVSPEARMTIVEHVVGAAIGTLNLPGRDLASFGFAPSVEDTGAAQIPGEAGDWYQLGMVALSGLIGRVVTETDLPRLDALVDEAFEAAGPAAAPLSPFIRQWLGRALQLTEAGATEETRATATEETQKKHGERALGIATEETQKKHGEAETLSTPTRRSGPVDPRHHGPAREVQPHRLFVPAHADGAPQPAPWSVEENLSPFEREVLAGRMTLDIENRGMHRDSGPATGPRVRAWRGRTILMSFAAAVVAIAGVEAGVMAWMVYSRPVASPPALMVQTSASGEHVLVPGDSAAPGALGVAVSKDFGWVRVTSTPSEGVLGTTLAESGGVAAIRISSPIELDVLEGSRVLGSVPGRALELSAGRHEIELVNEKLGYRAQQVIEVEAGQVIAIHVSPPPGWVTIEAPGAPEVSIDGKAAGRAPLGPLALAPGEHQVTFTDPRGRIERQRITVKTGATTQVIARTR